MLEPTAWGGCVVRSGGTVYAPGFFQPASRPTADEELLTYLRDLDPFFFDAIDGADQQMLARVRARLGPLKSGQVYGTYPIRPAPGGPDVANVVKIPVEEYLVQVFQNIVFVLRDYEGGNFNVRQIGGGAQ